MSDMSSAIGQNAGQYTSPSKFRNVVVFAAVFYVILALQLIHIIKANAYGSSLSALDLLGYLMALPMSTILGLRLLIQGKLHVIPVYLVIVFIFYIALVMVVTAPDRDLLSYFISLSGLLPWYIIGVGVGGMLVVFRQARDSKYAGMAKWLFIFASLVASADFVPFALNYLALPLHTLYYQSAAANAAVLLIIAICCIEVLWGRKKSIPVMASYLILGNVLAATVISMQSTSMGAIWLGLVVVSFWQLFWDSRLLSKLVLVFGLVVGIVFFMQTPAYEYIIRHTRYAELTEGGGLNEFSSLTSRFEILASFGDQFAVSPIWGHFEAEVKAGAGEGRYIHSLPLSFLTHTGLVGFTFISIILFLLLRRRTFPRKDVDPSELQFGRYMLVILALGSLTTFMTWSVLWFMMGLLSVRPRKPRRDAEQMGARVKKWDIQSRALPIAHSCALPP